MSSLTAKIAESKRLGYENDAIINKIAKAVKASGISFIDHSFLPNARSLYETNEMTSQSDQEIILTCEKKCQKEQIVWKRPNEFPDANANPYVLFQEAIEPNDIKQGRLGDCWVLCAISSMAEFPELIRAIFLNEKKNQNEQEAGLYSLVFCKNGVRQVVKIDDYIPCTPTEGPVYSRGNGPELWVMLIEKAYAKLHGSYQALSMGYAYEAMMDMTGAPCRSIQFASPETASAIKNGSFFNHLLEMDREGYLLSASTPGEDTFSMSEGGKKDVSFGLVPGHAYSLIALKQLSNGAQIVCVRNPWGTVEWSGDWSDNSTLWTPALKQELGPQFSVFKDDGTFWMAFQDMVQHFMSVNICQVRYPGVHPKPWHETRKKSYFVYDPDSKEVTTFMFRGSVSEPTLAQVALHQDDRRCLGAQPYLDIGVTVLRETGEGRWEVVHATGCTVERQVTCEVHLVPGENYLFIPCTTGGKFLQQSRLPPTRNTSLLSSEAEGWFTRRGEMCVDELFVRMNMDLDGSLNRQARQEIKRFLKVTQPELDKAERKKLSKEILKRFDTTPAGLSKHGFKDALLSPKGFHPNPSDSSPLSWADREVAILGDLISMGYDENLNLISCRGCVLSLHCDASSLSLSPISFDSAAYEEALEGSVLLSGKQKAYAKDQYVLYTQRNGYAGVSIVAKNSHGKTALCLTMKVTGNNVLSHQGDLEATVTIPPHEAKVIHHLFPEVEPGGWNYKTAVTIQRKRP